MDEFEKNKLKARKFLPNGAVIVSVKRTNKKKLNPKTKCLEVIYKYAGQDMRTLIDSGDR